MVRATRQRLPSAFIDARTTLEPVPASAGVARRFVRGLLRGRIDETLLEVVELLTSEVVTNVVLHARSRAELMLRMDPAIVRVEVVDESQIVPKVRRPSARAQAGRGLFIVQAMAQSWGVEPLPGDGKRVWFEVPA